MDLRRGNSVGSSEGVDTRADFPAPPEAIWDALIVAEMHADFTGHPATSDARVVGNMTAGGNYIEGEYLELDRPDRIVQT